MTIEYLSFVCFVGRLLLDHSASSSSSFMKSSFLIQMIRWIRGSLRIEFFIFLIAWGIFFEWWELDLQLLPSFFFSSYETSFFFFPKSVESNYFLLAHILCMNESHDPGRPFKVAITTSAFSTSSSTASSCSAFWIFTFFNCFLKAIFWFKFLSSNSLVKESNIFGVFGETLVVQVDSWLNQQWSSWPWPSSSCVRFLASSPSGTRTSILM